MQTPLALTGNGPKRSFLVAGSVDSSVSLSVLSRARRSAFAQVSVEALSVRSPSQKAEQAGKFQCFLALFVGLDGKCAVHRSKPPISIVVQVYTKLKRQKPSPKRERVSNSSRVLSVK